MRASSLLGLAALIALVALPTAYLLSLQTISNTARIPEVADLAFSVDTIDWGIMYPGQSYSKAFRAWNTGNVQVTLNVTASNWNPPTIASYLTLMSNATGTSLSPGQACGIGLVLVVAANAPPMNFTFDISVA